MKLWNRLLIILHLRRDWANELDFAPPAFAETPHQYDPELNGKTLTYCALCGGGRKHSIHTWDRNIGPWGKIHARSLEDEQRRKERGN